MDARGRATQEQLPSSCRRRSVIDDAIVAGRRRVGLLRWPRIGLRFRRRFVPRLSSGRTALPPRLVTLVGVGVGVVDERSRVAEERRRFLEALASRDRAAHVDIGGQADRIALVGRRQIVGDLHGRRGSRRRVACFRLAGQRLLTRAACDRCEPDDRAPGAPESHATQPRLERLPPSSLRAPRRDIAAPAESAAFECRGQ
jgi:hypothetical protein